MHDAPAMAIISKTMTLILDFDFVTKERVFTQRKICVKYQSSITYHSKAMASVKVFADKKTDNWTEGQLDR